MRELKLFNANQVFVNRPIATKANLNGNMQTPDLTVPPVKSNLPQLVVPGFNDHRVILFGKKFQAPVTPVDQSEKISMDIFKNIAPSVVQLKCKMVERGINPETGEEIVREGMASGSGSIIDKEGTVMTNFHVINGAEEIKIALNQNQEVPAKLIGADPHTDIAIVKIDLPKEELAKLPVMKLGELANVVGGQKAFAIGNPFSLYRTMTHGIVSALGRSMMSPGGRITKDVIQTDAPINPGNSGGALVNAKGEQIGINTQIYSPSGASAGLGFAVPIDTAKKIVAELKAHGKVNRPYIGLSGGVPTEVLHPMIKMKGGMVQDGVLLQQVVENGPAAKAGLKGGQIMVRTPDGQTLILGGDVITKINGKSVSNMTEIFEILDEQKIGSKLEVEYYSTNVEVVGKDLEANPSDLKTIKIGIDNTPGGKKESEILSSSTPEPLRDKDLNDLPFLVQ